MPEAQPARHFVTQIMPGVLQGRHRFLLFALGTAGRDFYGRMPPIGAHVSVDDFDGQQPRILRLEADNFGKLFAESFGDP